MDQPPRILLFGPNPDRVPGRPDGVAAERAETPAAAADLLRSGTFDAVLVDPAAAAKVLGDLARGEMVLSHLDKGVAVLDPAGVVVWANAAFQAWSGADPVGRTLLTALGSATIAVGDSDPLEPARRGKPIAFRVKRAGEHDEYIDLSVSPVPDRSGQVAHLVVVTRNVTAEVEQQKKLDALHQAGRDLAGLDLDLLAEMNLPTRVELLKQNLRRYIHDLLKYDIIELRLLDRRTTELKPLLEDGMLPEAAVRVLYAQPTGNGVTGYVAATGQSYLCNDTAHDPLYLEGAVGARSSMTVPLKFHDEVVGTLNVESPRVGGFGPDDLQFTELFSKEVAAALHTLDLLSAQQVCTAAQSIEAVNREIALPVDELMGTTALLLRKLTETDPDSAVHLRKILAAAKAVKASIQKVGCEMATPDTAPDPPLTGKRVLVFDPDERTRRQAHLLLGRLGACVETTGTAGEAVALLTDVAYDAVLMDIKPPDMGGYECFRRLKAARPGVRIAMTTGFGYDSAHSIVKAKAEGMTHVLFKPFRQDQVVKAVLGEPMSPSLSGIIALHNGKLT